MKLKIEKVIKQISVLYMRNLMDKMVNIISFFLFYEKKFTFNTKIFQTYTCQKSINFVILAISMNLIL